MHCLEDTLKIHQSKKMSSKPSGKGHTSPGENVTGKVSLSKCETPKIFQASVATSQDNLFKIP